MPGLSPGAVQGGGATNHKPFTDGNCLGCHDPHGTNVPGLLVVDQKTLCLKCHASQKKELASGSVHAAFGAGDCTRCHNPHKAGLKKLLVAKPPDLCLACHTPLQQRLAAETKHAPVDDCLSCHHPHAAAKAPLLAQTPTELCTGCHASPDKAFTTAHLGIDPARMACASCHDPHASKDKKLFKKVAHPPFTARQCDACHTVSGKR